MMRNALVILVAVLGSGCSLARAAENTPRNTDQRNLAKLQESFLSWKFGMFIHFNMATFAGVEWANGREDPLIFKPTKLNCGQWADAAVAAHMEYAILTVKHTGGWSLWDSQYTDHDIAQFKNFRDGKGDLVREFCDAFRKRGLNVGFYYCFPLFSKKWQQYSTLPIDGYEDGTCDALTFIKNQFTELLTNYGDISVIWVDQAGSLNGGLKKGDWAKVKAHIHALQPKCVVIANNATSYAVTDIFGYEYPYSHKLPPARNTNPSEVCDKMQQTWFSRPRGLPPIRTVDYLVNKMLVPLTHNRSNYLLNCGPDGRGLLPDGVVQRLRDVGQAWNPNASVSPQSLKGSE